MADCSFGKMAKSDSHHSRSVSQKGVATLQTFPLASFTLSDNSAGGSIVSVHVAHEAKKLIFFVDNSPWSKVLPRSRSAQLLALMWEESLQRHSPFANRSKMADLCDQLKLLEEEEFRRTSAAARPGTPRSLRSLSLKGAGVHKKVKWQSVTTLVRRIQAKKRAITRVQPPPRGLCGCVTFEVEWSKVHGIMYQNFLQVDTLMSLEVSRALKREFDGLQRAQDWHAAHLSVVAENVEELSDVLPRKRLEEAFDAHRFSLAPFATTSELKKESESTHPQPVEPRSSSPKAAVRPLGFAEVEACLDEISFDSRASPFITPCASSSFQNSHGHGDDGLQDTALRMSFPPQDDSRTLPGLSDAFKEASHQPLHRHRLTQESSFEDVYEEWPAVPGMDLSRQVPHHTAAKCTEYTEAWLEFCGEESRGQVSETSRHQPDNRLIDGFRRLRASPEGHSDTTGSHALQQTRLEMENVEPLDSGFVTGDEGASILDGSRDGWSTTSLASSRAAAVDEAGLLFSEGTIDGVATCSDDKTESVHAIRSFAFPNSVEERGGSITTGVDGSMLGPRNLSADSYAEIDSLQGSDFHRRSLSSDFEDIGVEEDGKAPCSPQECLSNTQQDHLLTAAAQISCAENTATTQSSVLWASFSYVSLDEALEPVRQLPENCSPSLQATCATSDEGWFLPQGDSDRGCTRDASTVDSTCGVTGGEEDMTKGSARVHPVEAPESSTRFLQDQGSYISPERRETLWEDQSFSWVNPPLSCDTETSSSQADAERRDSQSLCVPQETVYTNCLIKFQFNNPLLPLELRRAVMEDHRLLRLVEAGLPPWAIVWQTLPLICHMYRPWIRHVAMYAYVAISLMTALVGLYDLYKNVPILRETLARALEPVLRVLGSLDMATRLKYLGTIVFLQNFQRAFGYLLALVQFLGQTCVFLQRLFSPLLSPFFAPFYRLAYAFTCLSSFLWGLVATLSSGVTGAVWSSFTTLATLVQSLAQVLLVPCAASAQFLASLLQTCLAPVLQSALTLLQRLGYLLHQIGLAFAPALQAVAGASRSLKKPVTAAVQAASGASRSLKRPVAALSGTATAAAAAAKISPASGSVVWDILLVPLSIRVVLQELFSKVFKAIRGVIAAVVAFVVALIRHRTSLYIGMERQVITPAKGAAKVFRRRLQGSVAGALLKDLHKLSGGRGTLRRSGLSREHSRGFNRIQSTKAPCNDVMHDLPPGPSSYASPEPNRRAPRGPRYELQQQSPRHRVRRLPASPTACSSGHCSSAPSRSSKVPLKSLRQRHTFRVLKTENSSQLRVEYLTPEKEPVSSTER